MIDCFLLVMDEEYEGPDDWWLRDGGFAAEDFEPGDEYIIWPN